MPSRSLAIVMAALVLLTPRAVADSLPAGFVYLSDVEPNIAQDIRYYGADNFLGRRVTGYEAPECVLTEVAARALAQVHARLNSRGLGLQVYDCYRPARAVADFVAWSQAPGQKGNNYFYPTLAKTRLFALGYIASRSNHSAGSTVDVGLVQKLDAKSDQTTQTKKPGNCLNPEGRTELDMGSDFDCFHPRSNFSAGDVGKAARENRTVLRQAMTNGGFEAYELEWWHFRLKKEPFPKRAFDFPITRKSTLTPNR